MNTTTTATRQILTGVQTVNNYPYGRLQCTMSFSIEYVKGKGYRNVMQSINPKTGRLNAPKKSTYSHFMYMFKEESTGHIKFSGLQIRGYDSIACLILLLSSNTFEFTDEQSQDLLSTCIACIKISASYTRLKEGNTMIDFLEATKVKEMIRLYKEHLSINELTKIGYSVPNIEALEAK